eukprot:3995259-Alexandrium_andersonii.AAC.1
MSASLVGSEMCIRDSCKFSRDLQHFHDQGRARQPGGGPQGKGGAKGVAPVSYTHLTLPTICSV